MLYAYNVEKLFIVSTEKPSEDACYLLLNDDYPFDFEHYTYHVNEETHQLEATKIPDPEPPEPTVEERLSTMEECFQILADGILKQNS